MVLCVYFRWRARFPGFIGLMMVFREVISGLMVCCGLVWGVMFMLCVYFGTGQRAQIYFYFIV